MAKKRFTDGLESLMGESSGSKAQVKELLLFPEMVNDPPTPKYEKRPAQKGFAAELQSFLTEAFEESFEAQMSLLERDIESPQQATSSSKPLRRPPTGL
ncbi:MAG: hypothetical protein HUU01_23200, partial [Saprospiraceae bacterium]|nr:hypothetical protein [Saprospiraceae bacterium]